MGRKNDLACFKIRYFDYVSSLYLSDPVLSFLKVNFDIFKENCCFSMEVLWLFLLLSKRKE